MEFWSTLWAVVFVLCLLLFAVVAVYVSVGPWEISGRYSGGWGSGMRRRRPSRQAE